MSKGTLAKMEAGHGFTGEYLLIVAHFFGMSLSEFANPSIRLPTELKFRERIHEYHKKHKSIQDKVLNSEPTLISLIEFRLKENFLQQPRAVNDVIEYCKNEYSLKFESSVVSQALINAVKNGWLKRTKSHGRNYVYQVKKRK